MPKDKYRDVETYEDQFYADHPSVERQINFTVNSIALALAKNGKASRSGQNQDLSV